MHLADGEGVEHGVAFDLYFGFLQGPTWVLDLASVDLTCFALGVEAVAFGGPVFETSFADFEVLETAVTR